MRLPTFKPEEVVSILRKAGFKARRQTGSHLILRHPITGRIVPVPIHARDLKRGVLRNIIKQAGLTVEEFLRLA